MLVLVIYPFSCIVIEWVRPTLFGFQADLFDAYVKPLVWAREKNEFVRDVTDYVLFFWN